MPQPARLQRPGFGLPLHPGLNAQCFEHAIDDPLSMPGFTLREKAMLDFINQITDKPQWWAKVHDEHIVARWRDECGREEQQRFEARCLDQQCFEYCISELREKAANYREHGVIAVLDVQEPIVKFDLPHDDPLGVALRSGVLPLENVRPQQQDWHPGSDGLVLDLVHPSLFPLQYGVTRVLPYGTVPKENCAYYAGQGEVCDNGPVRDESIPKTLRPYGSYQWLPTDIMIAADGSAHIQGYVNNVHPQRHAALYSTLGKAVETAIPLWNQCLCQSGHQRIEVESCGQESYEHYGREGLKDGWDPRDESQLGRIIQPSVRKAYVPADQRVEDYNAEGQNLRKAFPDGLQVIFKLANIHLTPDKPTYSGSNWHVEGALNERICATALYYYDQGNIEDSFLEFRRGVGRDEIEEIYYLQEWHRAIEETFGIKQSEPAVQHLGRVLTRPNRMLAFPNLFQHRVTPFSLRDPSKPGHRKILAMFLVDPHFRILSTSNVPPQRRDWWAEEVRKILPFSELPIELFEHIMGMVEGFPISWESACEARAVLMAERGGMNEKVNEEWENDIFRFCEH